MGDEPSQEEGLKDGGDVQLLEDWKEVTMPMEDNQRKGQTSIQECTGKRARVEESIQEDDNIPEVRKIGNIIPKPTKSRRQTGKLNKKEQKRMKQGHGDIGLLLAPSKPMEDKKHEEALAKEVEVMEVVNEEREERLDEKRGPNRTPIRAH